MSMNTIEDKIQHARTTSKGRYLPRYNSFHDLFLDHFTKQSRDKIFMKYYVGPEKMLTLTYHECIEIVRKTSAYYISIGLQKGDRIVVAAHNHPDTIIQYLAAWYLGLSVIPLNMGEDDQRLSFIIRDSGCKLILCST